MQSFADALSDALAPGVVLGTILYLAVRLLLRGFFTVDQSERAVKTSFGRARRLSRTTLDLPIAQGLRPDERERYVYPQVEVIPPGGPYFKWPWERVHKVTIATRTMSLAEDPEDPTANENGTRLEAVTKDHLRTAISGQIRFRVSEQNLYAFLFGIKRPLAHVMGYFVSVLRQRTASFEAKPDRGDPAAATARLAGGGAFRAPDALAAPDTAREPVDGSTALAPADAAPAALAAPTHGEMLGAQGVSINDLRKNLRDLNDTMEADCKASAARYGITLDACLITRIDPPDEVESALAAINTAYNHVSSEISLAQAAADQRIVQSRRAVEIETLRVHAEIEPLRALAGELRALEDASPGALDAYVLNLRLGLIAKAKRLFLPLERSGK
jgi:regulator of protease activity HflC (stomatin/prohibitin superfamily)